MAEDVNDEALTFAPRPLTDIGDLYAMSDSTPEQAVDNINKSKARGVSPTTYKELKSDPTSGFVENERPEATDQIVVDRMIQSDEHSAAMRDDVGHFNAMKTIVSDTLDSIQGKSLNRDLLNLQWKKLMGETLTEDEQNDIVIYNTRLRALNEQREKYGLGVTGSLPAEVVGMVYDFGRATLQQKEIVAGGAVGGAVLGGARGLLGGIPGVVTGATIGGLTGSVMGFEAAQLVDLYQQSSASIYNEITQFPTETPIPDDQAQMLSRGGGMVMTAAGFAVGRFVPKNIPWLNKFMGGKAFAKFVTSPQGSAFRQLAVAMGKSAGVTGGVTGIQSSVAILAEEVGKTYDGTETSFTKALENAAGRIGEVGQAAVTGAAAGAAFTAAARTLGPSVKPNARGGVSDGGPTIRDVNERPGGPGGGGPGAGQIIDIGGGPNLPVIIQGTQALQLKTALEHASTISKLTVAGKHLPDDIDAIRQRNFEDAGVGDIFIDKQELNNWADSEVKAKAARKLLGNKELAEAAINSPIRLKAFQFSKLVDEHPDIAGLAKLKPDRMSANQFNELVKKADKTREDIKTEADTDRLPEGTPVQQRETRIFDEDIKGEEQFLEQPTFTEDMNTVLPKTEIMTVNRAQSLARVQVADMIKAEATLPDSVRGKAGEATPSALPRDQIKLRPKLSLLKGDSKRNELPDDYEVVVDGSDHYVQKKNDPELTAYGFGKNKTEAIKDFLEYRMLNRAKLRAADKIKGEELEKALRVKSFEEMVDEDIYSDELMAARTKAAKALKSADEFEPSTVERELKKLIEREQDIQSKTGDDATKAIKAADAEDSRFEQMTNEELESSAIAKAYDDIAKVHLKELKIILDKHYGAFKTGVKRIALPSPTSADLKIRARNHIGNLKVSDLNVQQWITGERKSQRKAVDAVLKNQFEVAAREKENAAYNILLAKETTIANKKIKRAYAFIAGLKSPAVQGLLKDASKTYSDAVNLLLDVYNFDPSLKNQAKIDAYSKYVDKMINEGKGDVSIPPEVLKWLGTTKSAKELTLDQTVYLYDKMKAILHQAKLHNRLLREYTKRQLDLTNEIIEKTIEDKLLAHPQYDPAKANKPAVLLPEVLSLSHYIRSGDPADLFNNIQYIVKELDEGFNAGFFAEQIYQPLAGTGKHEGPFGYAAEVKLLGVVRKEWEKALKVYGPKFKYLGLKKVNITQFKGIPELNNGRLRKIDLLGMMRYLGNEENIKSLENFGVSVDTIKEVLEQHMTYKDMDLIQQAEWNLYNKLAPRLVALHKATEGIDLELVKPKPFKLFGRVYEGGYAPIEYTDASSSENIARIHKQLMDLADPQSNARPVPFSSFEGIVRSPHTKERTGSKRMVSLDFDAIGRGFQNVVHDLTMRVPVRDVVGLIKRPSNRDYIKGTIGHDRYNTLLNHVISQTNSLSAHGMLFNENQKKIQKVIENIESSMGITHIAYNISSVLMTAAGVPQVLGEMGVLSGKKHLSLVASKFSYAALHDWGVVNHMLKLAAEIDPSLKKSREGLGEFATDPLVKFKPKKNANLVTFWLGKARDKSAEIAFEKILGTSDDIMKTMTVLAAYQQYVAGEAPGHPLGKIQAMEPKDLDLAAKAYAAQVSASTLMTASSLEKAAIQKTPYLKSTARYWNESRNSLNNRFQDVRDIKNSNRKMIDAAKRGDYLEAVTHARDADDTTIRMIYIAIFTGMVMSAAQLKNPIMSKEEEEQGEDFTLAESLNKTPGFIYNQVTTLEGWGNIANNTFLSPMPVMRDLVFGAQRDQAPTVPLVSGLYSIIQTTGVIPLEILNLMKNDLTLLEAIENLTPEQYRHFYNALSIGVGGLPVNGVMKIDRLINGEQDSDTNKTKYMKSLIGYIKSVVADEKLKREELSEEEEFNRVLEKFKSGEEQTKTTVDTAEEVLDQLNVGKEGHGLSQEDLEIIKHAESRGRWDAKPSTSGAFGLYQFVPATWQLIMETTEGRAAKLTEEGRISKNPRQQIIAMNILSTYNARNLRKRGIPVNPTTMYFAHHFGSGHAKEVFSSPDKTRLSRGENGLLSPDVLRANPQLIRLNVKTAGDMKRYLKNALARGKRSYDAQEDIPLEDQIEVGSLD